MGNEIGKSLKNAVMSNPDVGFAELPPSTETVPVRKTSSASNNTPSDTKQADPTQVPWDEVLKSIRAADYDLAIALLSRDAELTAQLTKHEIALLSTRERLQHVIRFKFFESVKQQQRELSAKFAVLFDNCGGNKREALEYLQHHVEQLLSARPVPNHVTPSVSLNDLEHVLKGYTTLLRVLEDYAYIEQIFGLPAWLVFVSRALQMNEHVIQGTLKHWQLEHRGLLADTESAEVTQQRVEHIARTLDQLALLANRSEHYKAAVKLFYERAATRLGLQGYSFVSKSAALAARDAKQLAIEEHVHESLALFAAVSQVLHTFYLPLEQFFLQHSITTMIAESDRELRANAASDTRGSVLDLLFVVLEQAMTRVLITAHHAIIATMVEHLAHQTIVHHLVTRELAGRVRALVNDLQMQLPGVLKAITATNSAAPTSELTLTWLLYWLNELCVVPSDLDRLRDQLLVIAKQSRAPLDLDQGQQSLEQLVTEHMSRAKNSCQQLIASTARDLVTAVVYPQCCRSHVARFERLDYDIDAGKYKDYELNDPWIKALIDDLRALLVVSWQHKHVIHRDAWWQLIAAVLALLLSDMERVITLKLAFSPLGAIQLDKDVRHLFEFSSALVAPDHSVRNQFTRMLQICSLLSIERVTEVYEYWTPAQQEVRASEDEHSDTIK